MKLNLSKRALIAVSMASLIGGCHKSYEKTSSAKDEMVSQRITSPKLLKDFTQVNLLGDNNDFSPARVEPGLINAWGVAFSGTGPAWVTAMGGGISSVVNSNGSAARANVAMPTHTDAAGGNPTGVVNNATQNFKLPNGIPARFIFAQANGVISGWNGGNNAIKMVDEPGEVYTGIALASDHGVNFLYAANFSDGTIDVFDTSFVEVDKPFIDNSLPKGYSPFNIQLVDGQLYVMYAKNGTNVPVDAAPGNGFVSVFNTDGSFVRRFASEGQLNAPWGITKAPAGFWPDEADAQEILLIGNFGDGHINAYTTDGVFQGQLRSHGKPISIEGLWALAFAPPTSPAFDHNSLFFAAGPGGETHGLFGFIRK